jgi:hypothetical protein
VSVENALEELYSVEPGEFTKTRDRLVKDLKKVGDKDGAALIAAKRKPTQIAYVLNQLARREPDAVGELIDVGRALVREQRKAMRGEGHGLKESMERQRKAIADVAAKAAAVMKDLGVDPNAHLAEIATALQAALVDPIIGTQLEEGRMEKAPEAAIGFGAPMAPESSPAPAPAPRSAPAVDEKSEEEEDEEEDEPEAPPAPKRDEKAIAAAKKHAEAAASDANKARHGATQADRETKALAAKSTKLTEQATAAEREAKEAIALAGRLAEQAAAAQAATSAAAKKAESLAAEAETKAATARQAEAAVAALEG